MNNTNLRIILVTAAMLFLSVGFANAACYLNIVDEDSSEYQGYLNVSLDISTEAPYNAEMVLTDETQAFFPDAAIGTILLNIPADQIESVTDSEGNDWVVNETAEDADNFGTFNTVIEPGDDAEPVPAANISINLVDTWDESFPRNDQGYLIATEIINIGETGDESAWVTLGFCEAPAPIDDEGEPVDEIPADDEEPTDEVPADDEEPIDEEPVDDNETAAGTLCYLDIVQEDKSEYEEQLNATLLIDNETDNRIEIELSNETLEAFGSASISMILLNVPADEIENVTDADGNELEFAENETNGTNDQPFGEFLTEITARLVGQQLPPFGNFITEIRIQEAANATGPINISFTEEWEGVLPPNNEGYVIATEVQNIGETDDDSAWITLGSCEIDDTAANDTTPANETEGDIFITLQSGA